MTAGMPTARRKMRSSRFMCIFYQSRRQSFVTKVSLGGRGRRRTTFRTAPSLRPIAMLLPASARSRMMSATATVNDQHQANRRILFGLLGRSRFRHHLIHLREECFLESLHVSGLDVFAQCQRYGLRSFAPLCVAGAFARTGIAGRLRRDLIFRRTESGHDDGTRRQDCFHYVHHCFPFVRNLTMRLTAHI